MVGKSYRIVADSGVNFGLVDLVRRSLLSKWRATRQHLEADYPATPDIDPLVVAEPLDHLGCTILARPVEPFVERTRELRRKTEVTQLQHTALDQQVLEFDVSVDDLARVAVLDPFGELVQVPGRLGFFESFKRLLVHEVVEVRVAKLENERGYRFEPRRSEEAVKGDHVRVLQLREDVEFAFDPWQIVRLAPFAEQPLQSDTFSRCLDGREADDPEVPVSEHPADYEVVQGRWCGVRLPSTADGCVRTCLALLMAVIARFGDLDGRAGRRRHSRTGFIRDRRNYIFFWFKNK